MESGAISFLARARLVRGCLAVQSVAGALLFLQAHTRGKSARARCRSAQCRWRQWQSPCSSAGSVVPDFSIRKREAQRPRDAAVGVSKQAFSVQVCRRKLAQLSASRKG